MSPDFLFILAILLPLSKEGAEDSQRSDPVKSRPAKTCRSVEAQADTEGSAGLLPYQPGRHMYGAAAELQLCPSRSYWRRARAQEGDVLAVDDVLDEPA